MDGGKNKQIMYQKRSVKNCDNNDKTRTTVKV